METRQTISEDYRRQQQELHKNPHYGIASIAYAPIVKQLLQQLGAHSIADYGAGKCNLKRKLDELGVTGIGYFPYDPAFPEYGTPRSADLVCCIDVLEHIEPDYLDNVLGDLRDIVRKYGFLTIHTGPAMKVLADGRNAHLIQKPRSWWLPILSKYFEVIHLQGSAGGFWVVVVPRAEGLDPPSPESA
ncbi:MAG TPA: hypothetical protein VLS49_03940 [Usitatibacter sp.]|nr:hypothetical protein [Usitatibacter sp.]